MLETTRSKWLRYSFAVASVLAALVLSLILYPLIDPDPITLFFLAAVILSVWFGGLGPGLVATLLAIPIIDYFLLQPTYAFSVLYPANVLWLLTFLGVALLANSILEKRNQTAKRYSEQSELLRVTLASIGDGVIATDSSSKVTFINPTAETLTGWTANEAEGRDIQQIFQIANQRGQSSQENPVTRVLREGRTVALANHTVLVARDGTKYPIDDSGAPIRNTAGDIVGAVLVFRDISAQKEAETALSESETRFRIMADTAPVMMWMSDTAKNCVFCNKGWLDFTGRTLEEELAVGWGEDVHPDDYGANWAIFSAAFDARREYALEYRLRRRDGAYRWVIESGIPRYTSEDTFAGYIGSAIDIHDRKEAEAAMAESERVYRYLFENNPQPMWVFDRSSLQFLAVNGAAVAHYGYPRDEFLAMTMRDIRPPDEIPRMEQAVRALTDDAVSKPGLFRHVKKDGSEITVEITAHPMIFNGRPAVLTLIADMTSQLRAEAERASLAATLEAQRERLRSLVANVPGVVWESWGEPDADNQRIDFVSDYVETMLGYTVEEWVNTPNFWLTIVHPDDREQAAAVARAGYGSAEPHINRFRWVTKDGRVIPIETQSRAVLDGESKPVGMRGISVDVSERERLEAEHRRSEERITRLQELTANLSEALTPRQVAEVIVGKALTALGGHLGAVWLLSDDGKAIELLNQKGFREEIASQYVRVPVDVPGPINDAIRAQQALWIESLAEYTERYPTLAQIVRDNRTESSASVPLIVNGEPIGAITLSFQRPNALDEDDRAFVVALADQCAQALERARLYDAELQARAEAEAAQQRLAFVAEASTALASSLDYETTLKNLANLAVPTLCDTCGVYMADENGVLNILTITHPDPAKAELAYQLYLTYPPDPNTPGTSYYVLRTGRPQLIATITDDMLVAVAKDEEHLRLLRAIGFTSLMNVPLMSRDQVLGVVAFVSTESGRHYTTIDLALATEVARRAALAVDNARLYMEAQGQRERLSVILGSIGDAVIATDTAGRISFMNTVAQTLTGWTQADAQGQPLETVFRIINDATHETVESPFTKVMREGATVGLANHTLLVSRDGHYIPIDDSGAPIRDDQGNITGVVLVFRNITERRRLEERLRFLVDAGAVLTSSLIYATTLETIVQLAVPRFADWCIIRMPDEDGKLKVVAMAHADPAKVPLMRALEERFPPEAGPPFGYLAAMQTGQPILKAHVTSEMLDAIAQSPEHRELLGQFNWRSHMSVPAKAGDEIVALITFATSADSGRSYDEHDLALAEELARRTAIAIQNARLYTNERQAREMAERASARIALLQQITSAFSEAATPFQVADVVVGLVFLALGVDAGMILLVSEDGATVNLLHQYGYSDEAIAMTRGVPVDLPSNPTAEIMRERQPLWFETFERYRERYPQAAEWSQKHTGTQSVAMLPLIVEKRVLGAIVLAFRHPHAFGEEDRAFWMALAHQGAQAMERARLFAAEQVAREQAVNILESISDAFYTVDWDWRFTYVNRKAEEVWGRRREELIGKVLWEEFPQVVGTDAYHQHQRAGRERRPIGFETVSPIIDQWIEVNVYPSETGLSVYFRDIRERKLAEQEKARLFEIEQRARREAEEANELKLKFLAMISHELRTPLTSIKGFATTLLADDVTFEIGYQRQFIRIIDEEADKLTELIEQLLDLSRLQAGNLRIAPRPMQLVDIMDDARAQLETLSASHTLISRVPDELPKVMADPLRIAQVLVNLVDNAVKYAPTHTPIIVSASQNGDTIQISVSDAGPGIPAEAQDYVFEAFRQVEMKRAAQKGAGLGLAICKGLIEAHGGRIWIDTTARMGTTIAFTLPVARAEDEQEDGTDS